MTSPAERTPATDCPDENQLALLAEGGLGERERGAIDRHLDGCAVCTRLVAELAGLAAPARAVPARYRIVRQLGAGAMGVVWEAEDEHLRRRVALKFVRPESAADRAHRSRLFREARALAQLRHPNVVAVYDVGEVGQGAPTGAPTGDAAGDGMGAELFLALELVEGTNARTWREAAPRSPAEILAVWRQAAAGVAAVHRAGIVHRDLKPDNILVAADGRVLVGDFGLATGELGETHDGATALTRSGAVIGTPIYMAPEQLFGDPATQRSDQYALCVSIWEALVGQRPFAGPTIGAIAMAMTKPLALPARADLRHVFAALARGLDPDPAKRWPDVDALIAALARPAPRRRGVALALGALGAAGLAAAATAVTLAAVEDAAPPAGTAAIERLATTSPDAHPTAQGEPAMPAPPTIDVAATASDGVPGAGKPRVVPKRSRTGPPPIAVQPAPVATPATRSAWRTLYDRATDELAYGDGAECLQLVASIPPVPAAMAVDVEVLRASCMMDAGDCAGGRAALEAAGRAQGWTMARLDAALDAADLAHCPLDAPPRARWPARARYRLQLAAATRRTCRPVLAFIAQHAVQLPDPREALLLETSCRVNDRDCAGARASWRQAYVPAGTLPAQRPQLEQAADAAFVKAFPRCP